MAKKSFREMVGADDLTERTEESYNSRESSGKYNDYFTDDMPLQKFICNKGPHILDVIPWIAGPGHPNVKENKGTHNVDVYVHFGIGITESAYLCPARMNRGDCPICEYQAELKKRKNYDEDFVKGFNAKRRTIYNVLVYDTIKDEDAGIMLWEASHHLTEKNIMAIARNNRTGAYIKWADPDLGKTIEFSREGEKSLTRYVGFKFTDRGKGDEITDDILADAINIEDYLDFKSYDELKKALGNTDIVDEQPLEEGGESYEEVNERTPTSTRRGQRQAAGQDEPKETPPDEEAPRNTRRSRRQVADDTPPDKEEKTSRRGSRSQEPDKDPEEKTAETGTKLTRRRRPRR